MKEEVVILESEWTSTFNILFGMCLLSVQSVGCKPGHTAGLYHIAAYLTV